MRPPSRCFIVLSLACVFCTAAFSQSVPPAAQAAPIAAPTQTKNWTGDLDVLLKHRVIRVAVPYSKTFYYTVKGVQRGVAYQASSTPSNSCENSDIFL